MLGLPKGKLIISEYDSGWVESFNTERKLLLKIIGEYVVDIQHIGSTSIGIRSKPIIDLLIGVRNFEDIKHFDQDQIKSENYYKLKVQLEDKVVFAKYSNLEDLVKTHILHVVEHGGKSWTELITFRNKLRANPKLAAEYIKLKENLLKTSNNEEKTYTNGKIEFIRRVLEE